MIEAPILQRQAMARNVEIKARCSDFAAQRLRAQQLADGSAQVMEQEDVFFNARNGRLKLRIFDAASAELIFYERSDQLGAKTSDYSRVPTATPAVLRELLSDALGVRAVVRKIREVYLAGRTRIHLDRVEELGEFIELEVVLGEQDDVAAGVAEANRLMEALGITEHDLIASAYVDLLESMAHKP